MKRLFKKGQRVKRKTDGRIMEVLRYIEKKRKQFVRAYWFDLEKKELRITETEENQLLKE